VDGLKALSDTSSVPIFQLTETYRLPNRVLITQAYFTTTV
jgi:hypothetical protein